MPSINSVFKLSLPLLVILQLSFFLSAGEFGGAESFKDFRVKIEIDSDGQSKCTLKIITIRSIIDMKRDGPLDFKDFAIKLVTTHGKEIKIILPQDEDGAFISEGGSVGRYGLVVGNYPMDISADDAKKLVIVYKGGTKEFDLKKK